MKSCVQGGSQQKSHVFMFYLVFLVLIATLSGFGPWKYSVTFPETYLLEGILYSAMPEKEYLGFANPENGDVKLTEMSYFIVRPVWTEDNMIFGLSGSIHWKEQTGYPMYWNLDTGQFLTCNGNTNSVSYRYIQPTFNPDLPYEVIVSDGLEVHLFDVEKCDITQKLIGKNELPNSTQISGISYHPQSSVLAYGLIEDIDQERQQYSIHTWNLATDEKQQISSTGLMPSISPSGNQITFYTDEGISVMNVDGSDVHMVIEKNFFENDTDYYRDFMFLEPVLNWSPDGKYLTYHYCVDFSCLLSQPDTIEVIVLDVERGTEEVLFTDGIYPYWKGSSD